MPEYKVALGSTPFSVGDGRVAGAGETVDIKNEDDPLVQEAIEAGTLISMEKAPKATTKKGGEK